MGPGVLPPLVLTFLLSVVVVTDCRAGVIRNWNNAALLASGLGFAALSGPELVWTSLAGALAGGVALGLVALGYRRVSGREGLGLGDVKFMVGAGAWVMPQGVAPVLLLASTAALACVVTGFAPRVAGHAGGIAFGPFLSLGCLLVYALQVMEMAPWMA